MADGKFAFFLLILALIWGPGSCDKSLTEDFGPGWKERWHHSDDEKYTGKFAVETVPDLEELGLKVSEGAKHYGLTALLEEPVKLAEGVTIQFEVKWAKKHTCGGGYLKYFTHDPSFKAVDMKSDTPYSIMFGPDKCGSTNKVHLILRHKSPVDGEIEEKHLESPPSVPSDTKFHVYTATIMPDNTVKVLIDDKVVKEGSLLEDFSPSINPPEEIPDPSDVKPETWVDDAEIPDQDAKKPDDWVDEEMIVDESAEKPDGWLDDEPQEVDDPDSTIPEDWDIEEDGEWMPPSIPNPKCEDAPGCGEWKAPLIPNPEFKGEWTAPFIENPDYKGPWVQRQIPNPKYFHDEKPLSNVGDIGAVGIEIWTMDEDMYFDNVVVTGDEAVAQEYRGKWKERKMLEDAIEEEKKKKKQEEAKASQTSIADFLENVLDNPALVSLQPYMEPIVEFARTNEVAFVGILTAGSCLLVFLFFLSICKCCCGRKSEREDTRSAKKEDKTGPDDTVSAEKSAEESQEDEDEDSEDDEPPKSAGAQKRRPKRVAE